MFIILLSADLQDQISKDDACTSHLQSALTQPEDPEDAATASHLCPDSLTDGSWSTAETQGLIKIRSEVAQVRSELTSITEELDYAR